MKILVYLTHEPHGCCTTAELMALAREDKAAIVELKHAARLEMTARGIPIDEEK